MLLYIVFIAASIAALALSVYWTRRKFLKGTDYSYDGARGMGWRYLSGFKNKSIRILETIWRGVWALILSVAGVAFVGLMYTLIVVGIGFNLAYELGGGKLIESNQYQLRSVGADSKTEGRFFLISGYVDEERVLNYIREDGQGGNVLRTAEADNAVVYEDSTDGATVSVHEWGVQNEFFIPGPVEIARSWEFRIPAGSITEDYTITN